MTYLYVLTTYNWSIFHRFNPTKVFIMSYPPYGGGPGYPGGVIIDQLPYFNYFPASLADVRDDSFTEDVSCLDIFFFHRYSTWSQTKQFCSIRLFLVYPDILDLATIVQSQT